MAIEHPLERRLDPVYTRVSRGDQIVDRCFSDLTVNEQKNFLNTMDKSGLKRLCMVLSESLRSLGDSLDIRLDD